MAAHVAPEEALSGQGEPVLDVQGLVVTFPTENGPVRPVRGVSFRIAPGEAVGVVGESGAGKSLMALAIARLIEEPGRVTATRLRFQGTDLLAHTDAARRHLLGTSMSMVFQDPGTSFNPTRRIGGQLAEVARYHLGMSRWDAYARAVDRLRAVHVPAPERRAGQYPHELSGGLRQRAMIGMGLMGDPALIIADEPTTALYVTIQQQVLQLLGSIRAASGVAILLITHDVAVVRQVCDRVLVMYAGRIVEELPAAELATGARHPYTRALVAAVPDMDSDLDRPLAVIPGRPVEPWDVPVGCAYAARCPLADQHCRDEDPALVADGAGRRVACWHAGEPIDLRPGLVGATASGAPTADPEAAPVAS
jgi:oligopeptide/dipeptide ABC transporter ATP-binding protein